MAHSALRVANHLIRLAHESNRTITPLQVMKLTYLCHGWMLGLYHVPLLDEPIEAWRYGPVVPDVYFSLRDYGRRPVTQEIPLSTKEYASEFSPEESHVIEQVSKLYGRFSGVQLLRMTHVSGTPWYEVWTKNGDTNAFIPDPLIEEFYSQKSKGGRNRA